MAKLNLVGKRFSKLLVISDAGYHVKYGGQKSAQWLCKCDCGKESIVSGHKLKKCITKSCGCLRIEMISNGLNKSHGMNKSSEYKTWCCMIKRCTNEKDSNYPRYGERGIKVCDSWLEFENFYADMGNKPIGFSIERIDNNGNYEPSNCKWANRKEQGRNTSTNRIIEFNGQKKCLIEWSEERGIPISTLWYRLNSGWTIEKTLTTPVRKITNKISEYYHD